MLSDEIVEAIADGSADIGIVAGTVDTGALETHPYRCDRFVLIVPRGHALAAAGRLRRGAGRGFRRPGPQQRAARFLARQALVAGKPIRLRVQLRSGTPSRAGWCPAWAGIVPESTAHGMSRLLDVGAVTLSDAWATRQLLICVQSRQGLRAPPPACSTTCWRTARARRARPPASPGQGRYEYSSVMNCEAFRPDPVSSTTVRSVARDGAARGQHVERGGGRRAGRLGIEPHRGQLAHGCHDRILGHRHGLPAATRTACSISRRRRGWRMAVPRPPWVAPGARPGYPRPPGSSRPPASNAGWATNRRGSRRIWPAASSSAKPMAQPSTAAAGACRNHHVVRRLEAEVLPHFVGDGLGALQEEGLPVTGVVQLA